MTAGLSTAPYSVAGVHGSRLSARHSASKTRVNALKARSGQDDIGFVPPLIPAQAGIQSHELRMCGSGSRLRGDERMGRSPRPSICISVSTHHSHNTFPLRGSVIAALLILLLPAPVKGWAERREGAFNDRACEARHTTLTRRVSHRFQTGALASRRSAWRFRLRVPYFRGPPLRDRALSPTTGQSPRGCSPPGRNLLGSAPPASSCHDFS